MKHRGRAHRGCPAALLVATLLVATLLASVAAPPLSAAEKDWNVNSGNWSVPGNWDPNGVPLLGDTVFVGRTVPNALLYLDQNDNASGLTIQQQADLFTNGHTLTIFGDSVVDGAGGTSHLVVGQSGNNDDFDTVNLDVNNGGTVLLQGGIVEVDNIYRTDTSSSLTGAGTVRLTRTSGNAFVMDGTIRPFNGTMTIEATGGGMIDLDGVNSNSVIDVTDPDAHLVIDAPISDAFNGSIEIEDSSLTFTHDLVVANSGTIDFTVDQLVDEASELIGTNIEFNSGSVVDVNGSSSFITANSTWNNGATLNSNGPKGHLTLVGDVVLNSGVVFNVNGTVAAGHAPGAANVSPTRSTTTARRSPAAVNSGRWVMATCWPTRR